MTPRTHQGVPPDRGMGSPASTGGPPKGGDDACPSRDHDAVAGGVPDPENLLKAKHLEAINLRLDFLSMVLAVLARSLPPREAAHAVHAIGERLIEQLGRQRVSESAEEAVAADLAPILAALQQR